MVSWKGRREGRGGGRKEQNWSSEEIKERDGEGRERREERRIT